MLAWLPVTRSVELLNTFSEIHTITTSYYKRRARWRKRLKKVLPSLATTGQSKFKVLTIKLQSLPTHLGTFWRHSANTWREAKSATRTGILFFAVLKIKMNDRKSREEFLSDIDCNLLQYLVELRKKEFTSTLSARFLVEEDLHFLPEGHKWLVLNTIPRLTTPKSVKSGLKRQTTSTQQLQSPESNLRSPTRKKVFTSGWNRLRVVPLSLSPSCVTRKKTARKKWKDSSRKRGKN